MKEMPLFDPQHVVRGLKIKEVQMQSPNPWHAPGSAFLIFEDASYSPVSIDPEFYNLNRPKDGDYYCQYEDGTVRIVHYKESFDGSGTGRYGDHGHWTETGDGTDYPGSYGVGPQTAKPFVPFTESDSLGVGDSFRLLRDDKSVDPSVHVVTAIHNNLVTYYESPGKTAEVPRDHVVKVIPPVNKIKGTNNK